MANTPSTKASTPQETPSTATPEPKRSKEDSVDVKKNLFSEDAGPQEPKPSPAKPKPTASKAKPSRPLDKTKIEILSSDDDQASQPNLAPAVQPPSATCKAELETQAEPTPSPAEPTPSPSEPTPSPAEQTPSFTSPDSAETLVLGSALLC